MRKVITPVILTAVLITAALFSGCTITGAGDVITAKMEVADFTSVDVEDTFEVEITPSDSFSVTISADKNTYDYVTVSRQGETLKIYLNPRNIFADFTLKSRTLKATVTMPTLYGLRLSGASKGTVSGFKSSDNVSIEVSGASSLEMSDIEVGGAQFEISGASKVTGGMKATDIKFQVSGASKVELQGTANSIVLNASGASNVNLNYLPLNYADVTLGSASEATIDVKETLDIVASGASRLYFLGNPTIGNLDISGASTVKHK
jgi:hypothetical protein